MIEKTILDYLAEGLDVPVYMELPEDIPDTFVLVEKTGSSQSNFISSAVIALQSYASTMAEAASLDEKVKVLMDQAAALTDISKSRLNSDYNFTDTSMKHYGYQAVYDLVYFE